MVNYDLTNPSIFQSVFDTTDPLTVLENENIVFTCYQNLARQMQGNAQYDASYRFKRDLIENYVLHLAYKKKRSKAEEGILSKYQIFYSKLFSDFSFDYLVGSKIYKYYEYILPKEVIYKEHDRIVYTTQKAIEIFNKFRHKERISNYELNYMFEFFTNNIDSENEMIKAMMKALSKWLLITNIDYGIYSKIFLLSYLMHNFCAENIYMDVPIYVTDKYLLDGKPHNAFGRAMTPHRIISLKYDLVNGLPSDIIEYKFRVPRTIKILHSLFHELQHIRQYNEFKNDFALTSTTFNIIKHRILNKYLSTKDEDEYMVNYSDRETEREANIEGWVGTYKTLNELAPSRIKEIDEAKINATITAYEQSVAIQTNLESRKQEEIDIYNVRKLTSIIAKHPGLLKEYRSLRVFYNNNGKRKKLSEIIPLYNDLEINHTVYEGYDIDLDVFDEFIKSMIIDDGINSYPLNQEEKYQITWFSIIFKLYENEYRNIKQMYSIKDELNQDTINHFSEARINYMQMYKIYLERNYNQIKHLKNFTNYHNKRFDTLELSTIQAMFNECIVLTSKLYSNKKGAAYGI